MSERIRKALAMGDLEQAAAWEAEAAERDGYDVSAELLRALAALLAAAETENKTLRADLGRTKALGDEMAGALERVRAERDEARQALETGLAAIYQDHKPLVARLCDEHLDRSGALLGRVRARAALPVAARPEADAR